MPIEFIQLLTSARRSYKTNIQLGANLNLYLSLTVPTIALLLCFVMGLQNAIVTKASKAQIRTTHMTGVITDIGIEVGKLINWNKATQPNEHGYVRANGEK